MAFWKESTAEPKRKYRFLITNGEEKGWWWATTAALPSYSINESTYRLGNHNHKYPGTVTWNDIEIIIVDDSERAKDLYASLIRGGYYPDGNGFDGMGRFGLQEGLLSGDNFRISSLKANGDVLETWVLNKPWIKSADFGQLDYSSDDLVTIALTICYDNAILE